MTDAAYELNHAKQCHRENTDYWLSKAESFGQKASCVTDPVTLKIKCTAFDQCKGGETVDYSKTITTREVTYPCGEHCKDLLLVQCCEECMKNQQLARDGMPPFDQVGTKVHCPGCGKTQLNSIKEDMCKMVGATFSCRFSQTCEIGDPKFTHKTYEQFCSVTPCDACSDDDLKAQCCAKCLAESACKDSKANPADRKICRGCAPSERLTFAPSRPPALVEALEEQRSDDPLAVLTGPPTGTA